MEASANEEVPSEADQRPIESRRDENDELIAREVKCAEKQLVANKMATMVKEVLNDVLRKTLHNVQSSGQSVVYNVVEHVMLDLVCKDVIRETLDAHLAK